MPNRDGTGPNGNGPKTGRGQGNCQKDNGNNEEQNSSNFRGRERGCLNGRGCGRGLGKSRRVNN